MSQYSRPAYTEEGQTEEEQLQLYSGAPELSLKFALPPVAQVRPHTVESSRRMSYTDHEYSQHHGSAQ